MDERTRTVKVRVAVANPEAKLRAGMFASVRIFLPGQEEALAVPEGGGALGRGSLVRLRAPPRRLLGPPPGRARPAAGLDWVEVKGGLEAAETLVADGAFLLKSDVLRSKMGAGCAD